MFVLLFYPPFAKLCVEIAAFGAKDVYFDMTTTIA
jgi:hypothetical protein